MVHPPPPPLPTTTLLTIHSFDFQSENELYKHFLLHYTLCLRFLHFVQQLRSVLLQLLATKQLFLSLHIDIISDWRLALPPPSILLIAIDSYALFFSYASLYFYIFSVLMFLFVYATRCLCHFVPDYIFYYAVIL